MNQAVLAPTAPPVKKIDNGWRSWIAENLMLGNHPGAILQVLMQNGVSEQEGIMEIDTAINSPYVAGAYRLRNRLMKHDWVLDNQRKMNRLLPAEVPRRHKLSAEEFLRDYYTTGRPVIITGMMEDWPARTKWNFDFFRQTLGDREVEVQFGREKNANYELDKDAHKRIMKFGEYVDLVEKAGRTNDFYMTAYNESRNTKALKELWNDIVQIPEYLVTRPDNGGYLWFGPAGTLTPFHHDLTNNFMAQIMGRKRLRLIPPCEIANVYNDRHCFTQVDARNVDLQRFPAMANAQILDCMLEPGELLFLPVGCWHFVEGLDVSMTITFTNFKWDNDFLAAYPQSHDF